MSKKLITKAINEKQTAKVLGVAVQTLRNWRHQRKGPKYIKMGRSVRYQQDDLQEYIDKKRIDPEKRWTWFK
jgi:predicted DNA-binding transcriptional regulator AlpA